jgi:hypothetical protein
MYWTLQNLKDIESSKYCTMVQYSAPLRYALLARRERGGRTAIGMCQSVSKTIQIQLISTCKRRQLGGKGFKGNEITPQVRLEDPKTKRNSMACLETSGEMA